ncbi:mitochondrial ribosomal subunit S27-domain-containing protein [Fomitopsis serialis]|uniref:mitochondrial ribosomal subunit S27-domain-containing protein n=1 Tax=Fomitopsis serialis TaxID=139415 RepID=UPI002008BEBE|nr:mitochondrial ribosomal subunit S27-domain-containing protein [Neoantrodia serialis]KAH9930847.1 mitochondrial ribosomal subunit S27-domain-containing protein [Neoantrodia serialis]
MAAVASAVNPSRLAALTRLRCAVFQTSYNPTSVRTGAKYFRARLRGPSMVEYYPPQMTFGMFNRMSRREIRITDPTEAQRLTNVEAKKKRGKGTPKKAKSAADSRRVRRRK